MYYKNSLRNSYLPTEQKMQYVHKKKLRNLAPLAIINEKLCPNPIKQSTLPYTLVLDEKNGDDFLRLSANSTNSRIMSNDQSSIIEVCDFRAVGTSEEYLVEITDNGFKRPLSNKPIHSTCIVGQENGFAPYPLSSSIILDRSQSLTFKATDLSGAINDIRAGFSCLKYYFEYSEYIEKIGKISGFMLPHWYTTEDDINLANSIGAKAKSTITIVTEADFYLDRIMYKSSAPFLITMKVEQSGYQLSNGKVHSTLIGADMGTNFHFSSYSKMEPQFFERKSRITLEFENLQAVANQIFFVLHGTHYYYER